MCGIAGELAFNGEFADGAAVRRISNAQACRGPDSEGFWQDGWAALGHRRLTIIDLTDAADQPMTDDTLGVSLVFNGCIYNYQELRQQLTDEHPFISTGDTEVVLRAYARWGEDFVDHLVGMFAIAIIDTRRQMALLVRDRLGIKPLYVARSERQLRFASDLTAILAGGGIDTSLNPSALHNYFSWHSIVPAPHTVLAGVAKVPPATIRIIHPDGHQSDRVYWQPAYTRDPHKDGWTSRDWEDAIEASLRTAVSRRLVADVPVGVLLSGGLDSSLLVALNADTRSDPAHTFSIGFESTDQRPGDEFNFSDAVARAFGTIHHQIVIPSRDLPDAVHECIAAMPEPMASHDVPAFYLLSQAVAEHVKVVQCGQGADEIFAGYEYHAQAPRATRNDAIDVLTHSFFDRSHSELQQIAVSGALPNDDVSMHQARRHLAAPGVETALDAILRLDTHHLMPDDPVKRVDSMTMAWSLEARVPFLDQHLVALAAQCPPSLKLSDGGKGVLKKIARRLLPPEVVDRRKGYFPVPAIQSLDGPVLKMARDALSSPSARMRQVIRPEVIDRLLDDPNTDRTQVGGTTLWPIAALELWLQANGIQ